MASQASAYAQAKFGPMPTPPDLRGIDFQQGVQYLLQKFNEHLSNRLYKYGLEKAITKSRSFINLFETELIPTVEWSIRDFTLFNVRIELTAQKYKQKTGLYDETLLEKLSLAHFELDILKRTENVCKQFVVEAEDSLLRFEASNCYNVIVADDIMHNMMLPLVTKMEDTWLHTSFDPDDFDIEYQTLDTFYGRVSLGTSNVYADGACGPRAFITAFCMEAFGFLLPRKPKEMEKIIVELKEAVIALLDLMMAIPENNAFIKIVITAHGDKPNQTYPEYKKDFMRESYHFNDYEIRLLLILVNMVRPEITQVNIISGHSVESGHIQVFTHNANPQPVCKNGQINLYHCDNHYQTIVNIRMNFPVTNNSNDNMKVFIPRK